MDVSRIMRDLSVEQLVQLQASLEREIETKKEELRQMVGRRYRDVLEASNAVKRLTEISDTLVNELHEMHHISSLVSQRFTDSDLSTSSVGNQTPRMTRNTQQAVQDFILLNAFISQVGSTGDDVGDVICFLLADAFYRRFSNKANFGGQDDWCTIEELSRLSKSFFDRLIVAKLELDDRLTETLGRETDWQLLTGCVVALALLKQMSVEALLDIYLGARLDYILLNLKSSSTTSLIGIIRLMRDTTQIVEDVFGSGEAIISALRIITTPEWCPDSVRIIIDDQLRDYGKVFLHELSKINALYPVADIKSVPLVVLQEKCTTWINQMCAISADRVRAMSEHFEHTEQIVEFIVAINQLFKVEWSSAVVSNVSIYHSLFGNAIVQRFSELIDHELHKIERDFLDKFSSCNCNPQPLFQKRAVKFDALLASGVSQELNDLVQTMFDSVRAIMANVTKYVAIGCETNVAQLRDVLADAVLQLVHRLLENFEIPTEYLSKEGSEFQQPSHSINSVRTLADHSVKITWLRTFRLFLAFVQHEPSVFCLCMNRDLSRISRCNKALHYATEFTLCNFMKEVINECVEKSFLNDMPSICALETRWMDLIEVFEQVEVESAGHVSVPSQLSRHYFQFLYAICLQVNNESIGHLFTSNVTNFISKQLGNILSDNLRQCADKCLPAQRICVQLLFDSRALFLMFPNHAFVDAAQEIETKIDAVERKLIDAPLSRNAKIFCQRTAMIFGQFLSDFSLAATAKEKSTRKIDTSLNTLVDITYKLTDIRRLALIPRLSKLRSEEEDRKRKGGKQRPTEEKSSSGPKKWTSDALSGGAAAVGLAEKIPSAASFSSFYDKISTGWFKNQS